jgi:hypothetical protein
MKVSNRNGIANQTGLESCVAHREVRGEALTGEAAGQPLRLDEKAEEAATPLSVLVNSMPYEQRSGLE